MAPVVAALLTVVIKGQRHEDLVLSSEPKLLILAHLHISEEDARGTPQPWWE